MGCLCSTPSQDGHEDNPYAANPSRHSASSAYCGHQGSGLAVFAAPAAPATVARDQLAAAARGGHAPGSGDHMSPQEIYNLAVLIFKHHPQFAAELDVLTPACVAVVESYGAARAVQYNEDIGEDRIGLCQMTLASARWLAARPGFSHYGTALTRADLLDPTVSLYFCTAYLLTLATRGDVLDGAAPLAGTDLEEYRVRAYHAGPKSWRSDDTSPYWCHYQHAKHQLGRLEAALLTPIGSTMHVVHPHETLVSIAAVCGITVSDILNVNPDIPHAGAVQACDCIVLPVPRVLPKLYIVQPSDVNLTSIARTHGVALSRLMVKNPPHWGPQPTPPSGWVLLMPGLRTKSEYLSDPAEADGSQRPGSSWYSTLMGQQYNPMQYYQPAVQSTAPQPVTASTGHSSAFHFPSNYMPIPMPVAAPREYPLLSAPQQAYSLGSANVEVQPVYRTAATKMAPSSLSLAASY